MQFLLLSISNPVHTQPKGKAPTQGQVQGRRLEWKRSPAVTLTVHTCVCLWEKSQHRSWNRSKILLICNASAEKLTGLRLCKPLASSEVGQLPPRSNEDFVFSKHTSGKEQAGLAFTSRAVWRLEIGRKPVFLYKRGTLAVKASYANPESHSVFFTVSFQSQIVCFTPLLTPQTQLLALKTWRNLRKIPCVTTAHQKTHTHKKNTWPPSPTRGAWQKLPESPSKGLRHGFPGVGKLFGFPQCQFFPLQSQGNLQQFGSEPSSKAPWEEKQSQRLGFKKGNHKSPFQSSECHSRTS